MALALLVLLLVLVCGGFGFLIHALWPIALFMLVIWIVAVLVRGIERI